MNEIPEEWRPVPGWDWYQVSNQGRVRTVNQVGRTAHFNGKIRTPYAGELGHLWLVLRGSAKVNRAISVHRIVLLAFVGQPPSPRHEAAHWDGDPTNNALSNLRWATPSENQMDRARHGTSNRGERQHMARLTAVQIPEIRRRLAAGETQHEVAAAFGVSRTAILAINIGKSWAWLKEAA